MRRRHRQQARVRVAMAKDNTGQPKDPPRKKPLKLDFDELSDPNAPDTFKDLEDAAKQGGILGRFSTALHGMIQTSRGGENIREPALEAGDDPRVTADDLAIRRAKHVNVKRMVVPEGVIIEGSMTSGAETEIAGRIEGNVTVEGRLHLAASALVSGNIRATTCTIEGLVEGKVECTRELQLGQSGRLNADVLVGKRAEIAGQVFGNISSGGALHLLPSAKINGDIRTKTLLMDQGAALNGTCSMRPRQKREEQT